MGRQESNLSARAMDRGERRSTATMAGWWWAEARTRARGARGDSVCLPPRARRMSHLFERVLARVRRLVDLFACRARIHARRGGSNGGGDWVELDRQRG
jgi:hypothetical protein